MVAPTLKSALLVIWASVFQVGTSICLDSGFIPRDSRPFELIVYRDQESLRCSYVALRETQIYRNLPEERHTEVSPSSLGHEKLSFIRHNTGTLWRRATDLCGETRTWDFPAFIDDQLPYPCDPVENLQMTLGISPRPAQKDTTLYPPLQIEPLIFSGPSENRVDLVFFSDGYTRDEKSKFIADATRLALDISSNQTFYTVKPLLNFWAAFTPSNESGIGSGGVPKDTPFGLYRDGTELRAVYYSNPDAARAACLSMGDKCDYPILMGNDPLYGGLGGEFTVITPSLANGALVLRHELGHSIINVGEEYDGGFAYFGVNAAHKPSEPVPWAHWLTNGSSHATHHDHGNDSTARVERSVMPMQEYPWTLLNVSTPWSTTFNSSGTYSRHVVRFSLSGLPEKDDLTVELDGADLQWMPRQDIGIDRWHYDVHRDSVLSGGEHEVKFTLREKDREGVAQLCSVEILDFGNETEFISTPGHYSLFPTFSDKNETSYRPTNEDCLMRIVTTPNFCKVCTEGLWYALLKRVDLIDGVRAGCRWEDDPAQATEVDVSRGAQKRGKWWKTLNLNLVPLAQFRADPVGVEESYTITWKKDGHILEAFTNKTRLEVEDEGARGTYTIDVKFATEEVRVDPDNLLASGGEFVVTRRCST